MQAPTPFVNVIGGIAYSSGGGRCSIGFAATRSGAKGFATAGHCGGPGTVVGISGTTVGSVQVRYYPGGDMAWASVRSSDTLVGQVSKYNGTVQRVLGRTEAAVGAAICRSGSTTGWRCGTVTRKNVSANYGAGTVSGLTQSTACAGQGDSGGSWITGSGQAQGVTSGGQLPAGSNNNCSVASPVTFFQPINPLISRFGLTLTLADLRRAGLRRAGRPPQCTSSMPRVRPGHRRCASVLAAHAAKAGKPALTSGTGAPGRDGRRIESSPTEPGPCRSIAANC